MCNVNQNTIDSLISMWQIVVDRPVYGRYDPNEAVNFFQSPEYFDNNGIILRAGVTGAQGYGFASLGMANIQLEKHWEKLVAFLGQITADTTGEDLDNLVENKDYQGVRCACTLQLAKRKVDAQRDFKLLFIFQDDTINSLRTALVPNDGFAGIFLRSERIMESASNIIAKPEGMTSLEYSLKLSAALWLLIHPGTIKENYPNPMQ